MADKTRDAQPPSNLTALRERLVRHAMGPKGLPSIGKELAYAVTDIRQKVVEEATYGRVVTPQPLADQGGIHGRTANDNGIHGAPARDAPQSGGIHGPADQGPGDAPGGIHGPASPNDSGGPTSGWDQPPSERQLGILGERGIDPEGMTRGTASQAIERAGYDKSWYVGKDQKPAGVSDAFRNRCDEVARSNGSREAPTQERPGPSHDR